MCYTVYSIHWTSKAQCTFCFSCYILTLFSLLYDGFILSKLLFSLHRERLCIQAHLFPSFMLKSLLLSPSPRHSPFLLSRSLFLSFSLPFSLFLSIYLSIHLSICLSLYLPSIHSFPFSPALDLALLLSLRVSGIVSIRESKPWLFHLREGLAMCLRARTDVSVLANELKYQTGH